MKLARRQVAVEIPAVPMLDIGFVVLVFFLVSAMFSATRGLPLELSPEHGIPLASGEEVLVRVDADGSFTVDCRPMALDDVLPYVEHELLADPGRLVVLYTDPGASYQDMIRVYDVLGSATKESHGFEIENLVVPTESEIEEWIALRGANPFEARCL
jgi:biopolymer transport protein ExbD